ncbi:IPT/TIG domain-containing protein [Actinoplanes sp. NPDC023714]|uniref:IPT/TIG domain-containing protein n=1 Tax=Actinoplanes sp. NPDC023714 TaxID=3154322 RepID=UPI0033C453C1
MRNITRARRGAALVTAAVAGFSVIVVHPGAVLSAAPAPERPRAAAFAVPVVKSITPVMGSVAGGTAVTVRGSGFLGLDRTKPESVMFGDAAATRIVVKSDIELLAISPPGDIGTVKVTVVGTDGPSTTSAAFAYREPLGVEITTVEASAAGGEQIVGTVVGGTVGDSVAAFRTLKYTALVGDLAATVAWVDATHVKITVPPTGSATASPVSLVQNGLAGPPSTGTVNYYPVITRVSPSRVGAAGGDTVQIAGAGFLGVDLADNTAVSFGDAPAASYTVESGTQINAVVQAGDAGTSVPVTVKTPSGVSPESDAARIKFRGPISIDTAGDTQFVRAGGGQHIFAVTGGTLGADVKAFAAEKISVKRGNQKLTATYVDPTHLRVTLPAITTETVTLTVMQDLMAGPEVTLPVLPVITNMSLASDTLAGGRTIKITIAGAGGEATGFLFGETPATCAPQPKSTTIYICTVPAATVAGPVRVSFTSGGGVASRFTPAAAFSYTDID